MKNIVDFDTNKGIRTYFKETRLGNTDITVIKENAGDIELFDLESIDLENHLDLSREDFKSFLDNSKNKIKDFIQLILKQLNKLYLYIKKLIFNLLRIGSSLEDIIELDKRYYNFYCDGLIMKKCQTLINIDSNIFNHFDIILNNVINHCNDVLDKCKLAIDNNSITFPNIKNEIFSITNKENIKFINGKLEKSPLIVKDFCYEFDIGGNCVKGKDILNKLNILKKMKNDVIFNKIDTLKEFIKKIDNPDVNLNNITLYSINIPNTILSMYNSVSYELYLYLRLLVVNGDRDNNPLKDIL